MTATIFFLQKQVGSKYIDINRKVQFHNLVYRCSWSAEWHWTEAEGAAELCIPISQKAKMFCTFPKV